MVILSLLEGLTTLRENKKNGHPEPSRRTDYFLFSTIKLVFDYAQTDNTCASVNNIALTRSTKC